MSHKEEINTPMMIAKCTDKVAKAMDVPEIESNSILENEILEHLSESAATFKSQQIDDPELSQCEKKAIARDLLHKNQSLFLAKFGKYLKKEHLNYFDDTEVDYEVSYHLKRLNRYLDENTRQTDVKNRRYQALKMLVEKGEYFSETEMMKRNPLLYENLIGKYLNEEEKKKRDNIDTTNITFVNLLLESIERDRLRNVKKAQEDAEDEVYEENDSDEDSDENEHAKVDPNKRGGKEKSHWGEMTKTNDPHDNQRREHLQRGSSCDVSLKERLILREEFVTHMYESFLDGKDIEFGYSTVDDNEIYDNVELRSHDEEEKYFDSESPETVLMENVLGQNDSEDELDTYMKSLKDLPPTNQQ